MPSKEEQRTILRFLQRETRDLTDTIDRARRHTELLSEYRTRLIADVVTGKLDVRAAAVELPDEAGGPRVGHMSNIQKYEADLKALVERGKKIVEDLILRHKKGEDDAGEATVSLGASYQHWYTESSIVIKQLLPDRLTEFEQLYMGDGRRKQIDRTTFNIQDWLRGVRAGSNPLAEKGF